MFSLPSLMNVLALLMLVFFIYAVLGVYMFGNITQGDIINDQVNFSKDFEGVKIKSVDLVPFFKELKGNLAFVGENDAGIMRNIVKMSLESDEEGFIYFNELLFKAMKRKYGEERTKKKVLAEYEF